MKPFEALEPGHTWVATGLAEPRLVFPNSFLELDEKSGTLRVMRASDGRLWRQMPAWRYAEHDVPQLWRHPAGPLTRLLVKMPARAGGSALRRVYDDVSILEVPGALHVVDEPTGYARAIVRAPYCFAWDRSLRQDELEV